MENIPLHLSLGDAFGDVDIPLVIAKALMAQGTHPFARIVEIGMTPSIEELEGSGYTIVRSVRTVNDDRLSLLAKRDDVYVHFSRSRSTLVTVYAPSDADAGRVAASLVERYVREEKPETDRFPLTFKWLATDGVRGRREMISADPWETIASNYSTVAAERIGKLVELERPVGRGRLILLHGAPGTGKTTAIRSLIRSWSGWCKAQYVLDPEQLFNSAQYLTDLMVPSSRYFDEDEEPVVDEKWNLYVIEDVDELIGADAKAHTGQAMARLLNLTDGLLGQGLNALVLLTTNEPITALHPAIIRPGRCLAEIEVPKLSAEEARAWARRNEMPAGTVNAEATLAELIARRDGSELVSSPTPAAHSGTYL